MQHELELVSMKAEESLRQLQQVMVSPCDHYNTEIVELLLHYR